MRGRAHKYRAVQTVVDGITFPSKLEARLYSELVLRQQAGDIRYFLRQVPLHLPGNVKLVVDFLVVHTDGGIEYLDAKGVETQAFKVKRKVAEATYPIRIRTWRGR